MPKASVYHPIGLFDADEWGAFLDDLAEVLANEMSAIDPMTGGMFQNDPEDHIDILSFPYDPATSRPTAVMLIEIITYAWPHRMANIKDRIGAVADVAKRHVGPKFVYIKHDTVSVTFLSKGPDCWVAR